MNKIIKISDKPILFFNYLNSLKSPPFTHWDEI